jgi:hypothetical protein
VTLIPVLTRLVRLLATGAVACAASAAFAQSCEGGVYLNPQVIRGEGTPQIVGAANELADFLGRAGLPVSPVVNVSNLDDALAAVKRGKPPCWIFGNPVVGLASGYRPVAVNTEEIQAAVLVLAELGPDKDPKPVDVGKLAPAERDRVLAGLKQSTCFGIKSGVTTALVKAEKLCGKVVELTPQAGMGQSYLPTKAAFEWHADRWVGLVTREQGARTASMGNQVGADTKIHQARLVVVPTKKSSWGYGIYLRPELPADMATRVAAQFAALKHPNPALARALDVGTGFQFVLPKPAEVEAMRVALDMAP